GERISKYGCQPDLISTLLPQMGLSARKYIFGKNLLDQGQKGFAFYDYENGFGFLTPKSEQIYDFTGKRYVANHSNDKKNDGITWKALIQYLYKDFMSR
ncbi:MAG: LTA synthase family protein, partial [Bacteroidota bacterium]|nr:LTA synthase family protein [Bacteroidota bacterium]